jgi:hemolysin-activating ACP:hemolysin acyltransferase
MFQDRKSFCDAIDLLLESELHRNFYLKDLERLVFPALKNKRMVLFYNDVGMPEGLYSHTFLTDVAQQGYLDGTRKIQPSDWGTACGEGTLWVIDFVAPFSNAAKIARKVQDDLTGRYLHLYPEDGALWRRPAKGGHARWTPGVFKLIKKRKENGRALAT